MQQRSFLFHGHIMPAVVAGWQAEPGNHLPKPTSWTVAEVTPRACKLDLRSSAEEHQRKHSTDQSEQDQVEVCSLSPSR